MKVGRFQKFGVCGVLGLLSLLCVSAMQSGCLRPRQVSLEDSQPEVLRDLAATPCEEADAVLVTVNGQPLTRGEFYRRVTAKLGTKTLLMEILDEELFLQEAEKQGISLSDEEIADASERFLEGMAQETGGVEKMIAEYRARGVSLEELKRDLAGSVRTELLRREVAKSMRKVDDETLRKYYEQTYKKERYETRHIAYSFAPPTGQSYSDIEPLKLQAYQKARRAVDLVREGQDFAEIAKFESDDKMTAQLGGALPPVSEDSRLLPPAFREVIFALEPGEVSEPVENPERPGFHIFQLTKVLPSQSFPECEGRMRRELLEREPSPQEVDEVLRALRGRAAIDWPEGSEGNRSSGLFGAGSR